MTDERPRSSHTLTLVSRVGLIRCPILVGRDEILDLFDRLIDEVGNWVVVQAMTETAEWTVDAMAFRSKGRNTPWDGRRLRGRPVVTIVGGEIVFDGR